MDVALIFLRLLNDLSDPTTRTYMPCLMFAIKESDLNQSGSVGGLPQSPGFVEQG